MAALPTTTTAFASGATEEQFKSFLAGQRDFLAGLLGTDGTTATAKTTLGVSDGVTSVNGNAGAISAAQVATAASTGYGYTPPNPASVAAVGHNHDGSYLPAVTRNSIGAFAIGRAAVLASAYVGLNSSSISVNYTINAGSAAWVTAGSVSLTGTWVCVGICADGSSGYLGLFRKIA